MTADGGMVQVCPACDLAGLRKRKPEHPSSTAEHQYYCPRCGATCDDPPRRERQSEGSVGGGLAKQLVEAEPGDLVTDGGTAEHPPTTMEDDATLSERLRAVQLCVREGNWDRAEDGLLHCLGEVRKRQGGSSDD